MLKLQKLLKFFLIVGFYNILDELKGVYDFYGYDALLKGVRDNEGNIKGGYNFSGHSYKIFEQFFGSKNPFLLVKDTDRMDDEFGTMFGNGFCGLYSDMEEPPLDIHIDLECTLEEIYNGCVKVLSFTKKVNLNDGITSKEQICNKEIIINKGTKTNSIKKLLGEGNQKPSYKNADLYVTIKEIQHKKFKRNGNDLFTTITLPLVEALQGTTINIECLDGRNMSILINEIIR